MALPPDRWIECEIVVIPDHHIRDEVGQNIALIAGYIQHITGVCLSAWPIRSGTPIWHKGKRYLAISCRQKTFSAPCRYELQAIPVDVVALVKDGTI